MEDHRPRYPTYWGIIELANGSLHIDSTFSLILVDREVIENHFLREWDAIHPGQVKSVEVIGHWFDKEGKETPDGRWTYREATPEEVENAKTQRASDSSNQDHSDQGQ